jgi:pyruvate kinase
MKKELLNIKKQTKIVATIGSASQEIEVLTELVKNGLDVARMNMSHGDHAEHGRKIDNVREVNKKLNSNVAVLVDLAGPKIRIGDLQTETVELVEGKKIILTTEKIVGDAKRVFVNYAKLPQELKKGNLVMLNDGKQKFIVEKIDGSEITCKILVGGKIRGRRGVNLPGAYLSVSAITEKDKLDIDFAISKKAEFLGVSFVRTAKDILDLKNILNKKVKKGGLMPKIIAKIETEESVEKFDEILKEVDGIMVARGDLAVEVPKEKVPVIQKKIIQKANEAGKFVITATQMLSSMMNSPVPTRAEVSDVANAIFDGSDAVMLSEESAVGDFPVLAVKTMKEIAEETDAHNDPRHEFINFDVSKDSIKKGAVEIAKNINAKCIIALTETGSTPFKISRFKNNIPIIALTQSKSNMNFLSLAHGVSILEASEIHNIDELKKITRSIIIENKLCKKDEQYIVVSGLTFGTSGASNMIFVESL